MKATTEFRRTEARPAISYVVGRNIVLNITNRCTLRCRFCPKTKNHWVVNGHCLQLEQEPTVDEILAAIGNPQRYDLATFSGLGEPTQRLYDALEVAQELRRRGLRTYLVTDGLACLVHGRDVTPDLENIIDTVSISLNAHDRATYDHYCPSAHPNAFGAVYDFADRVRYFVPRVRLTIVDRLPGVDQAACARLAESLDIELGIRRPGELE